MRQQARHRFSEGPRGGSGDMRPYFFHRDTTDVLEETFSELVRARLAELQAAAHPQPPATPAASPVNEDEVRREQYRTLFAYDAGMRALFQDNFDAFVAAMDDPQKMEQAMEVRFKHLAQEHDHAAEQHEHDGGTWDDMHAPVRAWEAGANPAPAGDPTHDGGDLVYDAAFRWACRVERWSRTLYHDQSTKDRDCYRVSINALLVPAKIAFALPGQDCGDVAGLEVSAMGYRQATIFTMRVLDSLASCYAKGLGDRETVHEFLDDGKEILADIQSRLAELEEEIAHRKGNG